MGIFTNKYVLVVLDMCAAHFYVALGYCGLLYCFQSLFDHTVVVFHDTHYSICVLNFLLKHVSQGKLLVLTLALLLVERVGLDCSFDNSSGLVYRL